MYSRGITEILFMAEAAKIGLKVSIPLLVEGYDCIVDTGDRVLKIQIKSTDYEIKNGVFCTKLGCGTKCKKKYSENDCDFFAVYVIRTKTWFIIPFKDAKVKMLLYPLDYGHRYSRFIDAWYLITKTELSTSDFHLS